MKLIFDIPVVFICPDSNEKYSIRKEHMFKMLNDKGFKNVTMLKSKSDIDYAKCVSEATIDILKKNLNNDPILILEDDVVTTDWLTYLDVLHYPQDADALYLGYSLLGGSKTINNHQGYFVAKRYRQYIKVENMLGAHAIIYISLQYKQRVIQELSNLPEYHSDVIISRIQSEYNIYSYLYPLFYQSSKFDIRNEPITKFHFLDSFEHIIVTKHDSYYYKSIFNTIKCPMIYFCHSSIFNEILSACSYHTIVVPYITEPDDILRISKNIIKSNNYILLTPSNNISSLEVETYKKYEIPYVDTLIPRNIITNTDKLHLKRISLPFLRKLKG